MDLSSFKTDSNIKLDADRRSGGYRILDTDVYPLTIKTAYLGESSGGAYNLTIQAETDDGASVNQTIYFSSGVAKGRKNKYTDKDGNEQYLPGFELTTALTLLTLGKEINELQSEEKTINLYDYTAKKEVPTKVNMVTELLGQEILAGIQKQIVDKNVKNDAGQYVPTGETREQNEIVKFFRHRDSMTVTEVISQAAEANYINIWKQDNAGKVRDMSTKTGTTNGAPAAKAAAAPQSTSGQVKSLFA